MADEMAGDRWIQWFAAQFEQLDTQHNALNDALLEAIKKANKCCDKCVVPGSSGK